MFWKRLLNLFAVDIGWTACAVGAAASMPWMGVVTVAALVAMQAPLVAQPRAQLRFIALVTLGGWLLDSGLAAIGVFFFPKNPGPWGLCPLWMAALWANFATAPHLVLHWLRARPRLAALLGFVGGPLAYGAGDRIGAMQLGEPVWMMLGVIAAEWAVVTPLMMGLAQLEYFDANRQPLQRGMPERA